MLPFRALLSREGDNKTVQETQVLLSAVCELHYLQEVGGSGSENAVSTLKVVVTGLRTCALRRS